MILTQMAVTEQGCIADDIIYSGGDYAKEELESGWQKTTRNSQKIYDYTDAIIKYTKREFEDINC